jgi:hypothetical protein
MALAGDSRLAEGKITREETTLNGERTVKLQVGTRRWQFQRAE